MRIKVFMVFLLPGAPIVCTDKVNSCKGGRESALGYFRDLTAVARFNAPVALSTQVTNVWTRRLSDLGNRSEGKIGLRQIFRLFEENSPLFDENNR